MIISLSGTPGNGKGTVADILKSKFGFTKLSFADPLKDAVAVLFGWPRHMLEGDTEVSRAWRETVDEYWSKVLKREITPRIVLQEFGTEVVRKNIAEDFWVNSLMRRIVPGRNYVIPDARFLNELEALETLDANTWMIYRDEYPVYEPGTTHVAEQEWKLFLGKFDVEIQNSSTLHDLEMNVSTLVKSEMFYEQLTMEGTT